MTAIARIYQYLIVELNGQPVEVGNLHIPFPVSLSGEKEERTVNVEVSSTQELWDVADSHMADFNIMLIRTDFDVTVEFIVNDINDVGEIAYTEKVIGTARQYEYGPWAVRMSGVSYANNTAGFTGTADTIDRVTVKNEDASNVAQVHILVLT